MKRRCLTLSLFNSDELRLSFSPGPCCGRWSVLPEIEEFLCPPLLIFTRLHPAVSFVQPTVSPSAFVMVLPHTLTLEFMEAVDNLIHDTNILDSTLHSRAQQYLEVFNESNPVQHASPTWVERIYKSSPRRTRLTTPRLFDAMYQIADELGVVAGKRYLSAAICASGEHAGIPGEASGPQALRAEQAAGLARALHQLSSTWVAFVLWPSEFLL